MTWHHSNVKVTAMMKNKNLHKRIKKKERAYLDFCSVLSSPTKQAQSTQQNVCISTEADGLHRVGRVAPTTTVTYSITTSG